MANDFSTIKEKRSSRKFALIRLEPNRDITDDLTSIGSNLYTISLPGWVITKLKQSGTYYTKVSGTPTANQYNFDEDTGLLTVYLTAQIGIYIYFYLFYSSCEGIVWYEDPENSSTTLREWEPKINNDISVNQSISNILAGQLSVTSSIISIVNDNYDFNIYLGEKYSFFQKQIKIWFCLDSEENIQKVFDGKMSNIFYLKESISINVDTNDYGFTQSAFMGDTFADVYYENKNYSNLYPTNGKTAIPYIFGKASRAGYIKEYVIPQAYKAIQPLYQVITDRMNEALCVDYDEDITTSNNRKFGLCRVSSNGFFDFSCTPTSIINSVGGNNTTSTHVYVQSSDIVKFFVGDTFEITQGGSSYYERILSIDEGINLMLITKNNSLSTGAVIHGNNCPTIVILDISTGLRYYCKYGRDYTASVNTLSSGNKYLEITFVNNFEASFGFGTLNPDIHKVYYRVRPAEAPIKHGDALKKMVEAAGETINAASITAANSAFTGNVCFQIPTFEETDFSSYQTYIETLLKSTLGYIFLNNNFEFEYGLFDSPSSSDEITDDEIIRNSFNIKIDYKDIVTIYNFVNNHFHYIRGPGAYNVQPRGSATANLHDYDRTSYFEHILEFSDNNPVGEPCFQKIASIPLLLGQRKAFYQFSTKSINLDNKLGDDILLNKDGLLGNDSTRAVRITGIIKSLENVSITAMDLIGL